MPFGGNDWLALTPEPPLEPELPLCDPHHHFWDVRTARLPYQRYLLHELAADINSGHNVRSTVFIEARAMYRADGPEEMRPVGEVEFVQGLAAASASGLYGPGRAAAAIVGHANLNLGTRVEPVLEGLQMASPNRFRGIRHSVTWDPHPEVENTAAHNVKEQLASDQFRAGARVLMRVGPYANRDDEVLATWRRGLAAVAACPNVTIKLGGIGMPRTGFDWHTRSTPIGSEELAAAMASFMTYCIEQFGPNRCMFESNFPVDKVSYSYNVMYNAFKRLSKGYSAAERAAMFHDTTTRVYRLDA